MIVKMLSDNQFAHLKCLVEDYGRNVFEYAIHFQCHQFLKMCDNYGNICVGQAVVLKSEIKLHSIGLFKGKE